MRQCVALLVALAIPLVISAQAQDDRVDNPPYKSWSAFKKGTTVKLLQKVVDKSGDSPGVVDATARPQGPAEMYLTYRLVEVTPEKVVVTMTQTEMESGGEVEHAPVRITYRARISRKYAGQSLPKSKVENLKEGEEELEIAGKKIKTHWVESRFKVDTETSFSKVWSSDEVPGGTVKSVTTKSEGDKALFETTLQLVSLTTEE
jgi:hypothetical protein